MPLKQKGKVKFHSTTARILYLSNRIRPGVKVACQYLCTRVSEPSEEDNKKLTKLIKYLWSTKGKKYYFGRGDGSNVLKFYVDGAFACHADGKSHGGVDC